MHMVLVTRLGGSLCKHVSLHYLLKVRSLGLQGGPAVPRWAATVEGNQSRSVAIVSKLTPGQKHPLTHM